MPRKYFTFYSELSKSSVMHCMQFLIALVKDQGIQKIRNISERNELVRQAPKPTKKRRCPNQFYSKLFLKSKVVLLKIESEKLVEKRRPLCAPRPPVSSSSMRWSNLRQEKQQQQRPRTICIRGHRPLCHSQPWRLFPEFYFYFYWPNTPMPFRQIYAPKSVQSAPPYAGYAVLSMVLRNLQKTKWNPKKWNSRIF